MKWLIITGNYFDLLSNSSTNSFNKCIKISLENLYIGTWRVTGLNSKYIKAQISLTDTLCHTLIESEKVIEIIIGQVFPREGPSYKMGGVFFSLLAQITLWRLQCMRKI